MERVIIIPVLNPDGELRKLIERNWELENQVILVDDGSDELYRPLFQEFSKTCIVLHHKQNEGKGAAIKTALQYIKDELWECGVIGIMDADGQHLPDDMEKLLNAAAARSGTLILGSRGFDGRVPWRSRAGNQITRGVFQAVTGIRVWDTQSGLRAFSVELLDFMLGISGKRYEYEMNVLMACARKGVAMIELPIHTIYHDPGNTCSHFRGVRDSIRIYKKLLAFSLSSLSSFFMDYLLFVGLTFLLPQTAAGILEANVGARAISAACNYAINCRLVFHEKQSVKTAAGYFLLAVGILILNSLILPCYLYGAHMSPYLAKILTEMTLFVISWLIQRQVIFGRREAMQLKTEGR